MSLMNKPTVSFTGTTRTLSAGICSYLYVPIDLVLANMTVVGRILEVAVLWNKGYNNWEGR